MFSHIQELQWNSHSFFVIWPLLAKLSLINLCTQFLSYGPSSLPFIWLAIRKCFSDESLCPSIQWLLLINLLYRASVLVSSWSGPLLEECLLSNVLALFMGEQSTTRQAYRIVLPSFLFDSIDFFLLHEDKSGRYCKF